MSLSFQTNVTALTAETNLQVNSNFQSQTITRLTSGFRINSSGDDAAGLAVANSLRSTIAELTQGVRNANDGASVLQTIDGGLNNISNILDQLKSLATQSASGTFAGNRATLNQEFTTLLGEIDRQAANIGLGTGTGTSAQYNANLTVYIGGGSTQANAQVSVDLSGSANVVNSGGLGIGLDTIDTVAHALTAIAPPRHRGDDARPDPGTCGYGRKRSELLHQPGPVADHQRFRRRIAHSRCGRRGRSSQPDQVAGAGAILGCRPGAGQCGSAGSPETAPINQVG